MEVVSGRVRGEVMVSRVRGEGLGIVSGRVSGV